MIAIGYFILAALLCALAFRRKPDWCPGALAAALVASIAVASADALGAVWSVIPFAATIDALICLFMLVLWSQFISMRAWAVGGIGLFKTGAGLLQYSHDPYFYGWAYFIAINIGFLAQIMVAGGLLDAVGYRLDRLLRRIAPERHRLLRDGTR